MKMNDFHICRIANDENDNNAPVFRIEKWNDCWYAIVSQVWVDCKTGQRPHPDDEVDLQNPFITDCYIFDDICYCPYCGKELVNNEEQKEIPQMGDR